ncbi:hypothetical protein [Salipiger abyssi]|uniref:hypothetical protein n=1 Tax=Salipiger abyssi TaxID=1250539 RepID=UPI0009787404|nr:hypothetical protein [Salipiger abyssi]
MTYPTFPTDLPPPMPEENGSQLFDARRMTTFDAGPPKSSLRHAMVPRTVRMSFHLLTWQVHAFNRFYQDTCRYGSVMFWMRDYRVDGKPLLTSDGTPRLNSQGVPLLASKVMLCAWGDEPPVFSGPVVRRQNAVFEVVEMPA